jgi:manganese/zinc/iron transport system ATP- binding protein
MIQEKTLRNAVEVENLTVAYDMKPVLWNVSLEIPEGKMTAVIGPNGAGKTTLIKAILGLLKPISGTVRFAGGTRRNNTRIGYVPQVGSVDWDFPVNVFDAVLMGSYGRLGWIRRPRKQEIELTWRVLEKVGMEKYASRQISLLSGGQQQRVFLARALVQQADIYFMDEPFKGVDAQTEKSIVMLLKELRTQGKTIVAVHHDLQTAADYFDFALLINLSVTAFGSVEDVLNEENLKKTYRSASALWRNTVYYGRFFGVAGGLYISDGDIGFGTLGSNQRCIRQFCRTAQAESDWRRCFAFVFIGCGGGFYSFRQQKYGDFTVRRAYFRVIVGNFHNGHCSPYTYKI